MYQLPFSSATEQALEPLGYQLTELETAVQDQRDKLSAVKSNILRNNEKISRLMAGINLNVWVYNLGFGHCKVLSTDLVCYVDEMLKMNILVIWLLCTVLCAHQQLHTL